MTDGAMTWREVQEWAAWNNVTDDALVVDMAGNVVTSVAPSVDGSRMCVHVAEGLEPRPLTWGQVREHGDIIDRAASVWVFLTGRRELPAVNLEWHPGHTAYLTLWSLIS